MAYRFEEVQGVMSPGFFAPTWAAQRYECSYRGHLLIVHQPEGVAPKWCWTASHLAGRSADMASAMGDATRAIDDFENDGEA